MVTWVKYIFFLALIVLGLVLLSNWIVHLYARPHIVAEQAKLKPAQAAIILGAGVYQDGRLTPVLEGRVNTAIELYRAGLVKKILMSGDNGSRYYNEVSPVHNYLLEAGVPPEDIFLDYAGFDTYDTMYRARAVFGVESAIVVTQNFHLPRAVFIADAMDMEVQGYGADNGAPRSRYSFRETLARVKAVFEVRLRRPPAYLGEQIPITGDGQNSVGE